MKSEALVTLNAGSSSLRGGIFERTGDGPVLRQRLSLRGLPDRMIWERHDAQTGATEERALDPPSDPADAQAEARAEMVRQMRDLLSNDRVTAFSHRVVHGGEGHRGPVEVRDGVLSELEALSPLAPSHQPHNLAAIRDVKEAFAGTRQVACFDTAFHRDLPRNDRIYALPRELIADGIIRYGFHGLSYQNVADTLARDEPDLARGRVVVAHLGHGVSMCALEAGRSVATTMGMTALDGLPMGRRPGTLDPGILLYLIEQRGMAAAELREMLYERAGLLGLSGISGEMIDLLQSEADAAAEAVAFFVYRCQREIGSLAAALGGIDALVFTGGMGENAPQIRARICDGLAWLGVRLDPEANENADRRIGAAGAQVTTLMIPTDEESVLAAGADKLLSDAGD